MKSPFETIDAQDDKTIRKSLITFSILSIALQRIEFTENVLNFFVTEVIFQRDDLVLTLKWTVLFLLLAFLVASAPSYISEIYKLNQKRLETWRERRIYLFNDRWGLNDPPEYRDTPEDDAQSIEDDYKRKKKDIDKIFETYELSASILKLACVNFGIPVILAAAALAGI